MSVMVKICGLTDADDVAAAIEAGADALGFVFAESVRRLSVEQAVDICRQVPAGVRRVAVMLHPTAEEWRGVADVFKPDVLQTDAEDFAGLDVAADMVCWPVVRERDSGCTAVGADTFLYEGQKSGQGKTVDWGLASRMARRGRMILAGELGPHNVADAVRAVRPWGVDASSALECAPGRKSRQKMVDYVLAAKTAAA